MAAIFCITAIMNAQVCKISQSNDNVEVYSCYLTDNNSAVLVTVGNDSQNISANVTVTVEVTYGANTKKTFSNKGLAKPNQTSEISIPIPSEVGSLKAKSVTVISITGTKCIE